MSEERSMILRMLEQGRVTVEEAERLLAAVNEAPLGSALAEASYDALEAQEETSGAMGAEGWARADPSAIGMAGIAWPAREDEVEAAYETSVSLPPGGRVRLKDAHGGASITGADVSEVQVQVLKRVRARDAALAHRLLREFRVHVAVEGGEVVIRSSRPRLEGHGDRHPVQGMWAFYQILIPRQAGVAVEFQHGKVQVAGIAGPAELSGAHGDWEARELAGPARLKHEHGSVRLTNLGSGLEAYKGHGPLEIGAVQGDLRLKAQHSAVRITGLEGAADLVGGHGDWEARDLAGPVRLRHEHGSVQLTNLGAGLDVQKSHGSLEVIGVQGALRLASEHGSRSLRDIAGDLEVRHSHGPVAVRGAVRKLQAQAQHARLDVELAEPPAGDIRLRLEHAHASLRLPAGTSARIDVAAQHGHIEAPGLALVEKGRHFERVRGMLGSGEHHVTIEGCHSNVSVLTEEVPRATEPQPTLS